MTRLQQVFLAVALIAGLVVAGWIGYQRIEIERANSTVAVAVDYNDVLRAAALAGKPPQEILAQIKATGASHVAVTELTLDDLVATRRLFNTASSRVFLAEPSMPAVVRKRIQKQLTTKLPRPDKPASYDYYTYLLQVAPRLGEIGVGYDEAVEAVREAGLSLVARPQAKFVSDQDITAAIAAAGDINADIVVFAGTRVLGYQKQIEQTAQALRQSGLKFGYVELAPQAGEQALAHHLDYKFIRTHSITEAEMEQISLQRALDRFSLAAGERKVRLCYVRLFFTQGDPIKRNLTYIGQLIGRLKQDGFTIGSPRQFNSVAIPDWALSVMFAAIPRVSDMVKVGNFLGIVTKVVWMPATIDPMDAVAEIAVVAMVTAVAPTPETPPTAPVAKPARKRSAKKPD